MPAHVQAVIAREKGAPVTLETVVIPDPGRARRWCACRPAASATPICTTGRAASATPSPSSSARGGRRGRRRRSGVTSVGPVTSLSSTGVPSAASAGPVGRASPVLLFDAQRDAEDDAPRRHRARAALGIGAFAEKTLVAAGQCTKVDPAARPEAVGLLGCGVMAGFGAAMFTGEVGYGDSVAVSAAGGWLRCGGGGGLAGRPR